jgi:hypothetical protein
MGPGRSRRASGLELSGADNTEKVAKEHLDHTEQSLIESVAYYM